MTDNRSERHGTDNHGLAGDRALVRAIGAGSLDAWREFVERYAGLLLGLLRRHLFSMDEDAVRTVFVDILAELHGGALATYRGEGRLAVWLAVYARRRAKDHARRRRGRRRPPAGWDRLDPFEREVYRHYFIDRLPLDAVLLTLRWSGLPAEAETVAAAVRRIEETVGERYLERLAAGTGAGLPGSESARMAAYLARRAAEREGRLRRERPDEILLAREAIEEAARLRRLLADLSPEDRRVLHLKYVERLKAPEIASRLGIADRRRVYTLVDRAIRRLRRLFLAREDD